MDETILESVKKALGIVPEYEYFDSQLVMHINTVFAILSQIGVGGDDGYAIVINGNERWDEVLENDKVMNMVKTCVFLRVKMLFDPPTGSVSSMYLDQIKELEWRIRERYETV